MINKESVGSNIIIKKIIQMRKERKRKLNIESNKIKKL